MARHIEISQHARDHADAKGFRLPQIAATGAVAVDQMSAVNHIPRIGDAEDGRGKAREGTFVVTVAHDDPCIPTYESLKRLSGTRWFHNNGVEVDTWAITAENTAGAGGAPDLRTPEARAFAAQWLGQTEPTPRARQRDMFTCPSCYLQFAAEAFAGNRECRDCR